MQKLIFLLMCTSVLCHLPSAMSQTLAPSEKDALITVNVVNEKKKPQTGETVMFESVKNKKVYSGITKENGKFDVLVPKGDKYKVKYKAFTSDADYTTLDVPLVKGELLEFEVTIEFELPKQYKLDNVYFESGKATITVASYKELDDLVAYMKLKKTLVLEIAGHTDNVGTPEGNLKLSQDRSNSVRDYLVKKGIPTARIVPKGYGDTQPVSSNDTDAGKQKNRRTEVRVVKE
ncbi:MAG: OmpA family protein [Bacteroidetes bacterium]|nr:MAG: OmpA family protein [Bacteroidota bacterium]